MIILGLTGSIGMGKSNAATTLRRLGVPVFDADAEVHRLLARGGAAVGAVAAAFPDVGDEKEGIDRQRLGRRVFGDPKALRRLERILHPMVRRAEARFVARGRGQRQALVVLDIPLLFESGSIERVDFALVVSAPLRLQRERVMRRPGMSEGRFAEIRRAQMPDPEKRRRADFVVETALSRGATMRRLKAIVGKLRRGDAPRRRRGEKRCARSS